jgi:hypothetical protein
VPRLVPNSPIQAVIVALAVLFAWLAMQAVHECGHIMAAWLTGGRVQRVVLHPLKISRTDVAPNPHPLTVAWGGPIFGVVAPLLTLVARKHFGARLNNFLQFFTGFCLIANGAYIGAGSFYGIGDAGDLLRHGAPHWTLVAFGAASLVAGLWIWHRLTLPSEPGGTSPGPRATSET